MNRSKILLYLLLIIVEVSSRAADSSSPLPLGIVNTQNPNDHPLSPQEALKKITVPEGFKVTLFAGEPDLMQPIAFDFDDRGRLWVVENFSYPDFKHPDSDRIVIYTDKDGDGRFDERKVFWDKGHRLSGLVLGHGGVWVCSAPDLLFIPDTNGDDIPDGKPIVKLDGWTLKAGHNMVNGLAWGPDGWLYGRHGITAPSLVGEPGTADNARVRVSCSIWRYHPLKHTFEVVCNGTTNPWGLDWDEDGQAFFSNNVIGHLWHVIPGAHYKRMFGEDPNPQTYELMESCSDHKHFAGSDWTKSRSGQEHDVLGGGHSHVGAMIYQGDNWPDEYRHTLMMANTHGNRLLYDKLERKGSGYVATHGKNFLMANDRWFRGITVAYGPDGGVYASDWNDFGECHDDDGSYRTSGRIYKITYGNPKPAVSFDLQKQSDGDLVKLVFHKNEWYSRHARRLLQERAAAGKLNSAVQHDLVRALDSNKEIPQQLRALWALHAIGSADSGLLMKLLAHKSEYVRWWAIQLLVEESKAGPAVLSGFTQLAKSDSSPLVRLAVASALQRLPIQDRWPIASALVQHSEDANDQNLPMMLWYGIEPMVPSDYSRSLQLMAQCKIPLVRRCISRRIAAR
ncbi:MAG TPA: PVC-type heme-binding CxxCH protein [Candidatus Saccharimonadales bacterium]|nr:PVC-type heme-binding CxxCH protein [Candidatus Saccharimonadales bacterium]